MRGERKRVFLRLSFFVVENLSAEKVKVQVMPEKMQVIEKPLQSPRKKGYNRNERKAKCVSLKKRR